MKSWIRIRDVRAAGEVIYIKLCLRGAKKYIGIYKKSTNLTQMSKIILNAMRMLKCAFHIIHM